MRTGADRSFLRSQRFHTAMRAMVTAILVVLALVGPATNAADAASPETLAKLRHLLAVDNGSAGSASGAYVFDLTTGRPLFAAVANVGRWPASVEKIYTTAAALLRYGPLATFKTQLLATGSLDSTGTFTGTLYLKGGGDPTFGSDAFDRANYGTGATVQQLVSNLLTAVPMIQFTGTVVGDESWFDSLRGTAPYGFDAAGDIGDPLSALDFNGGLNPGGSFQGNPPLDAAMQLVYALRDAGVTVPHGTPTTTGTTPVGARLVAYAESPSLSTLVKLTNTPSNNFFAETLLKDLGATFGAGGTSAAGAAVVRAELAGQFHIRPALEDGSGLSRRDLTSPLQVVSALRSLYSNPDFVASLPVAGRTGTLATRMRHSYATGRCLAKTGTLLNASDLAGYCHARDGHVLVFAFLMNDVYPAGVHRLQDAMTNAVALYDS
jgi:D-alanyl-D-alanine carboxypeptidase/D-alanyl-D-alanine-endopeptidase (penicillin-binding protein 4)